MNADFWMNTKKNILWRTWQDPTDSWIIAAFLFCIFVGKFCKMQLCWKSSPQQKTQLESTTYKTEKCSRYATNIAMLSNTFFMPWWAYDLMTVSFRVFFFSFFLPACPCAFIAPLVFIFEAQVHTWFQAIWVRILASVFKAMWMRWWAVGKN